MQRLLLVGAAAFVVAGCGTAARPGGRDARVPPSHRPTVQAAFARESYAPGTAARLVFFSRARDVRVQVFRAAEEKRAPRRRDEMTGAPVGPERALGSVAPGHAAWLGIARWEGGLYYARLTADGGKIGYAPFVLRPRRLGERAVAVVLPTQTWQAYNFRDDDHDGTPDTWYGDRTRKTARLARPFENRGVPPHYIHYDEPFLRWLTETGKEADYLSDGDLGRVSSGDALAAGYDLLVFPGHHEYVTTHEYDVVERYRDLGGNLVFLSANNFYYRIFRRGDVMTRAGAWRDLGRPEAALIGVQFFHNDGGRDQRPWIVRHAEAVPWLFAGTGLHDGSRLHHGGIEADTTAPTSPPGTIVIAEIPHMFGWPVAARMTYYASARGARVFAAGAFTMAGAARWPRTRRLMENLWEHMT